MFFKKFPVRASLPPWRPPSGGAGLCRLQGIPHRGAQGAQQLAEERREFDRKKKIIFFRKIDFLNRIWESTKIFNSFFQLTTVDASKTLEELKLFPQETLTLEEK